MGLQSSASNPVVQNILQKYSSPHVPANYATNDPATQITQHFKSSFMGLNPVLPQIPATYANNEQATLSKIAQNFKTSPMVSNPMFQNSHKEQSSPTNGPIVRNVERYPLLMAAKLMDLNSVHQKILAGTKAGKKKSMSDFRAEAKERHLAKKPYTREELKEIVEDQRETLKEMTPRVKEILKHKLENREIKPTQYDALMRYIDVSNTLEDPSPEVRKWARLIGREYRDEDKSKQQKMDEMSSLHSYNANAYGPRIRFENKRNYKTVNGKPDAELEELYSMFQLIPDHYKALKKMQRLNAKENLKNPNRK